VSAGWQKFWRGLTGKNMRALLLFAWGSAIIWELYKYLGRLFDDRIPLLGIGFPVRSSNVSMPHVWSILGAFFQKTNRASDEVLVTTLFGQAMVTLRVTIVGFTLGVVVGMLFAILLVTIPSLERALLPWVVASHTIPLVAIAPMVMIWGGRSGLPIWFPIAIIAAFLCFVPVTINALRGMKSPTNVRVELMRSYAARRHQRLMYLQLPSSLPHLFGGLKIAATASVVGALVGELSAGTGTGLGRTILNFTYYYMSGPEKLYATIIFSGLVGILFVKFISLIEYLACRKTQQGAKGRHT